MKSLILTVAVLGALCIAAPGLAADLSGGDPQRGAKRWSETCSRCHNIRSPSEFEAQFWRPIVTHMRIRAGLTGKDARDILSFLTSASADANRQFKVITTTTPEATDSGQPDGSLSAADGASVYQSSCVACHGADGQGVLPGVPDFTSARSPLATKTKAQLAANILNGFQSSGSIMAMPPKGDNPNLTEAEIARVIDYMLAEFQD